MLRTVDFFAGGGGLSLGFTEAGFDMVGAVENWEPAIQIYRHNFTSHELFSLDLFDEAKAIDLLKELRAEIVIGGPPCQDFSSAGKRDESGGRADLTIHYANTISQFKPRFFVMENVARASRSLAFKKALGIFKEAGYGLTIKILDAAYCGVPQLRKRLFVIGELNGHDGFLDALLEQNLSKNPLTLRSYFNNKLPFEHYYRHPRSYARRAVFSIDEPSPTIRGVNRPIPKGYPGHPGDTACISPELRSLTSEERARIQTFPKSFKLVGTKSDIEQVIGNAVPVRLAKYVGTQLNQYISKNEALDMPYQNKLFEPISAFNFHQKRS
jgi:DNA (cytosine-5)-methyltransferase 1